MSIDCIKLVISGSKHSGSEMLLLMVLAEYSNDDGSSYPAVATLAQKCRMTPRNANYILQALQKSGELRVMQNDGPRGTNRYQIVLSSLEQNKFLKTCPPLKGGASLKPTSSAPEPGFPNPLKPTSDEPSLNRQEPSARHNAAIPACPYATIQKLYHDTLPELPAIRLMGDDRKKAIRNFWNWVFTEPKSDGTTRALSAEGALVWIGQYLARARDNDFIMGRTTRSTDHKNWRPDIEYIFSAKGKNQVIEKTGETS